MGRRTDSSVVAPRDVTPAKYKAGSIKQCGNIGPEAYTIAVRTSLPVTYDFAGNLVENDWFRMHPDGGGFLCGYEQVEYWPDIYVAP
ncbi:MAG TPA: hypothetical protein VMS84_07455 [Mycobacterium sp.]|nr:hypothetical protein [Mycobacterium sp.]